jgi:hypothetical protein
VAAGPAATGHDDTENAPAGAIIPEHAQGALAAWTWAHRHEAAMDADPAAAPIDTSRLRLSRRPRQVGIIPDGNRRWAEARGEPHRTGYGAGLEPGFRQMQLRREPGRNHRRAAPVRAAGRRARRLTPRQRRAIRAVIPAAWLPS